MNKNGFDPRIGFWVLKPKNKQTDLPCGTPTATHRVTFSIPKANDDLMDWYVYSNDKAFFPSKLGTNISDIVSFQVTCP